MILLFYKSLMFYMVSFSVQMKKIMYKNRENERI